MPGKINYSFAGVPRLEISRTMTVLTNATPNVLAAPPNAQILLAWTTFRQAFGESMPQSKPGKGGGDFDVLVRGMIGTDGKAHDAVVRGSERAKRRWNGFEIWLPQNNSNARQVAARPRSLASGVS